MRCGGVVGNIAFLAALYSYVSKADPIAPYQQVYLPQVSQGPVAYPYANGQAAGIALMQPQQVAAVATIPQFQYFPAQRQPKLNARPPSLPIAADLPSPPTVFANNGPNTLINDIGSYQQQQPAESVADDPTETPAQLGSVGDGGDFVLPANRRPMVQWPFEQTGYQQNDEDAAIANTESYWPISIPSDTSASELTASSDASPTLSQDDNQYQVREIENPAPSQTQSAADTLSKPKIQRSQSVKTKQSRDTRKQTNGKPNHPSATVVARAHVDSTHSSSTAPTTSSPAAQVLPTTAAALQLNGAVPEAYAELQASTPRVSSVMRASGKRCRLRAPAVPVQNSTGNVRQEPLSGAGMGYHGHKLVRGVNIGGFLVPEFWITPSLISDIPDPKPNDYLQLCKRLGPDNTLKLMRDHWEKWVSEAEVQRLANAGITHLRIPLGHWEFIETDEGFVRGGLPYFKRLVYWASKYGMRVIPDMHTAPGSQNGFDNSGSTGGVNWTKNPENVALSKRALQNMLRYIASDPVILATVDAIDLLNEPLIDQLNFDELWDYDTGGHTLVTTGLHKVPPVISIIDRGFKDFTWWQPRWPKDWNSKYVDAWLDAHLYHVFDRNIDNWPLESHLQMVCNNGKDLKSNSTFFPIIVGEWSLALPQAALNGKENEARRRFAEAQLDAYDKGGAGWVFWCFKTESSPEWSFLDSLDRSWMPQPLSSREFPSCSH
ncbi:hypothetical protein EV175_001531 [Coemansia sp. RSA 1933]|nr:hypothetical protein EV175_001531 [Coemansia sp. RSA 1933]